MWTQQAGLLTALAGLASLVHTLGTESEEVKEVSWPVWTSPSSVSRVKVREFGTPGRPLAIAIHGAMDTDWVHHEWDAVALRLAGLGYYVVVPNLHSNRESRPGFMSMGGFSHLLDSLIAAVGGKHLALLLGKSWGGGAAAYFAAKRPHIIGKLVLVAPGAIGRSTHLQISCSTALFWAEDDKVVPIRNAKMVRAMLSNEALFHVEPQGGHKVLAAYTEPIAQFAALPTTTGETGGAKAGDEAGIVVAAEKVTSMGEGSGNTGNGAGIAVAAEKVTPLGEGSGNDDASGSTWGTFSLALLASLALAVLALSLPSLMRGQAAAPKPGREAGGGSVIGAVD